MASTEYHPLHQDVRVKQEDGVHPPHFQVKAEHFAKVASGHDLIEAQLQQQLSQSHIHLQLNEAQGQGEGQGLHPKHAVPFNGLSFHNPFDINSYPLTNPPLYDPTMHVPYGGTRHRRISISNGQIGQIVNHEAFFVDEDLLDELSNSGRQRPAFQDDTFADVSPTSQVQHGLGANQGAAVGGGGHWNVGISRPEVTPLAPEIPASAPTHGNGLVHGEADSDPGVGSQVQTPVPVPLPVLVSHHKPQAPFVAGVPPPNHALIYNNEVIYNPNDGPIPGSAAWKKERLLERNRVAASKCRQRKKQAQQQLQRDISKYEVAIKDNEEKIDKYEKLLAMYNSVLKEHFGGNAHALERLRPFVENPEI